MNNTLMNNTLLINLACSLCNTSFENTNHMIQHFKDKQDKNHYKEAKRIAKIIEEHTGPLYREN